MSPRAASILVTGAGALTPEQAQALAAAAAAETDPWRGLSGSLLFIAIAAASAVCFAIVGGA